MPGATLGIRRLQTPYREKLELRKCFKDILSLVKNPAAYYIDSAGKVFYYEKTRFVPLKYYKIKRVDKKGQASLLWLRGIDQPFIIPRPPPANVSYAGLLHLGKLPWLLYEYSESRQPDTRRKI